MRGRRDSDSLRLSQRSNGLAFSHHHFLSSPVSPSHTTPTGQRHTSMVAHLDSSAASRPRPTVKFTALTAAENLERQPIKSLIPQAEQRMKSRAGPSYQYIVRRRDSEASTISIKSFASAGTGRKRRGGVINLITMPSEILDMIFKDLRQSDWHSLMLTNSNLAEAAAACMYRYPLFATTYRYAQFAHVVSHQANYAELVRELDVSDFGKEPESKRLPEAGWREHRVRNSHYYQQTYDRSWMKLSWPGGKDPEKTSSSHPPPHPNLKTTCLSRDLPIGGLCHTISACQNLRKINISNLQISADFIISHKLYPPTACSGVTYVSDILRSRWEDDDLRPISNSYIVNQMRELPSLETVIANNTVSISTAMAKDLVDSCPKLKVVDFRKSSMRKQQPWAIQGTKEEVQATLRGMEEDAALASVGEGA